MAAWQPNPYALLLVISACVLGAIAAYAWRRRWSPGVAPITLLALGIAIWSLGYGIALGVHDLAARILWAKVQHIGIAASSVGMTIFALDYAGFEKWLVGRNVILLSLVPVTGMLLAWTNELHRLIWTDIKLDIVNSIAVLDLKYGVYFWFYTAYNYLVLLFSTLVFLIIFLRSAGLRREQSGILLVGTLFPWVTNVMYLAGWNPFPHLDLTPFGYSLTCIVISWGLFRHHLFDIVPIARDKIVESMGDGVIVLDEQARVVDINPAAQRMIGWPFAQAVGQPAERVFAAYADLVERFRDALEMQTQMEVGEAQARRWYDLHFSPLYGRQGRLIGRMILVHDITQRKQIEQAEREQRALAEALRDTAAVLTGTLELNDVLDRIMEQMQRVVYGDAAAIRMFEGDQARVLRWYVHNRPEVHGQVYLSLPISATANLRQMIATGEPLVIPDTNAESKWIRLPGAEWIRSYAGAPLRVRGQVIGFIEVDSATTGFYTPRDAERLHAFADQAAVAIKNAQLFDETRLRAEHMATLYRIGLAITAGLDLDQVLRSLYEQCQQVVVADSFYIALYDAETGLIRFPLFRDHEQDIAMDSYIFRTRRGLTDHVIETRRTLYLPDTLHPDTIAAFQIVRAGGTPARSFVGVPLILRDEVLGVLSMQSYQPEAYSPDQIKLLETIATQAAVAMENARLYTEARNAQEAAEAANAELLARNQELDAFAYTVAHDLKNPIGLILGHAGLLNEALDDLPPRQIKDSLQVITRGTEKLDTIVEELMLLAGVRKQEVTIEPLNMGDIINEALQRLSYEVQEKEAQIAELDASVWPQAMGYAPWIEEVWANYISNAIRYGGTPPCVELGATFVSPASDGNGGRGQVRFWVRDNGSGLTPEQQGKLFVPFERLSQARTTGHGLGLSIVRRIVEKLGGRVGVESELGQGSTFYFTLPAVPAKAD